MDFSIHPFLAWVMAWGATIGAVWFLFEKAEDTVTSETKESISKWLRNLDPAGGFSNWPAMFAAVFDRVFGERHLSWRCFWRSCVASLVSVIIMTLIWSVLRPIEFTAFVKKPESLAGLLIGSALLNIFPDYISLLESRYVIRLMTRRRSTLLILVLLAIDIVATSAVFFAGAWMSLILIMLVDESVPWPSVIEIISLIVEKFFKQMFPLSVEQLGLFSLGIFFYSTFFTSVWVCLYALSGFAVKVAGNLGIGMSRLSGVLDIEKKPLRSMGFLSIALISLLFLVLPVLR